MAFESVCLRFSPLLKESVCRAAGCDSCIAGLVHAATPGRAVHLAAAGLHKWVGSAGTESRGDCGVERGGRLAAALTVDARDWRNRPTFQAGIGLLPVSYTHLRAHET